MSKENPDIVSGAKSRQIVPLTTTLLESRMRLSMQYICQYFYSKWGRDNHHSEYPGWLHPVSLLHRRTRLLGRASYRLHGILPSLRQRVWHWTRWGNLCRSPTTPLCSHILVDIGQPGSRLSAYLTSSLPTRLKIIRIVRVRFRCWVIAGISRLPCRI